MNEPFLSQYGIPDSVLRCVHTSPNVPLFTHAIVGNPAASFPMPVTFEDMEPIWFTKTADTLRMFVNSGFDDGSGKHIAFDQTSPRFNYNQVFYG